MHQRRGPLAGLPVSITEFLDRHDGTRKDPPVVDAPLTELLWELTARYERPVRLRTLRSSLRGPDAPQTEQELVALLGRLRTELDGRCTIERGSGRVRLSGADLGLLRTGIRAGFRLRNGSVPTILWPLRTALVHHPQGKHAPWSGGLTPTALRVLAAAMERPHEPLSVERLRAITGFKDIATAVRSIRALEIPLVDGDRVQLDVFARAIAGVGLAFDRAHARAWKRGRAVALSSDELVVLDRIAAGGGAPVRADELVTALGRPGAPPQLASVLVTALRPRLGSLGSEAMLTGHDGSYVFHRPDDVGWIWGWSPDGGADVRPMPPAIPMHIERKEAR
jgi:hypothetical protein